MNAGRYTSNISRFLILMSNSFLIPAKMKESSTGISPWLVLYSKNLHPFLFSVKIRILNYIQTVVFIWQILLKPAFYKPYDAIYKPPHFEPTELSHADHSIPGISNLLPILKTHCTAKEMCCRAIDAWSGGCLAGPVIGSTSLIKPDLNFPDIVPVIMHIQGYTNLCPFGRY